jgi:hypothetical protein
LSSRTFCTLVCHSAAKRRNLLFAFRFALAVSAFSAFPWRPSRSSLLSISNGFRPVAYVPLKTV